MNKILFDLKGTQPTPTTKIHGGGRYGEMIFRRMVERCLPFSCCYDSRLWLNPDIREIIDRNHIPLYDLASAELSNVIMENKISRIFLPVYIETPDFLRQVDTSRCDIVATIHDLRNLELPIDYYQVKYKPWKNVLRYIRKRWFGRLYFRRERKKITDAFNTPNMKVVTDTYHSSYAFKSYFPELSNVDVPVFYAPSTIVKEAIGRKYTENYFLLVSCNRYNKNNLRAIMALDRLFSAGYATDYKVKMTGVNGLDAFTYKVVNRDRFECVGFVDEQELSQLYHDAYCFIFPSLQEGFGYPPLEAMHCGVPVLSTPYSSVPEICGGAVIYFNPLSIEEIMNRILMILDSDVHQKYSKLALERYQVIEEKQHEDVDKLIDYILNIE